MLNIKKKDKVVVLAGKDKGKEGEVLKVYDETNKVVVSKVNFVKRHTKPTQRDPGGIKEKESPISISNVIKLSDGKKVRVCRKCGEIIV